MYYLGTITGSSGFNSNFATGQSGLGTFAIPPSVKSLYFTPSASGAYLELGPSGLASNINRGIPLTFSNQGAINGPFRIAPGANQVGISTTVSGFISVRVYASPTS